ncbi:MAG: HAMP domain-containing sensor histidine kinase, partial [Bacteroidota bacterium]
YLSIIMILKQKKISEMKSDFINNMTHEFKTPIATISLAADSIENPITLDNKERILYYTKIIKEENHRMNSQVENILQMALAEKQDFCLELQPLDSHYLINKAIMDISLQLTNKQGKIYTELNAEKSIVLIDEMHFSHVIYNLLDNACKYSDEYPEIYVKTHNTNSHLIISVEDNGIGMTKDVQSRIFEKFYRKPTGNIHNVKGHGLGLSYVKAMITVFNGEIKVSSELGKGSTFTISIPLE